jgi:rod shape-determining protein MreC
MVSRRNSQRRWLWLAAAAVAVIALILVSARFADGPRGLTTRITLPVQRALRALGNDLRNITGSVGDLATLRERNGELEQQVAELTIDNLRLKEVESENSRLRGLLQFARANQAFDYRGTQVIGRIVGSEPNSAIQSIVIDLGSAHGMKTGMPVVTERGLVGRITDVYVNASRVLLITDSNSNVNTMLQNARVRGILRGRAGQAPMIDYLPQEQGIDAGDIVFTSGEGGSFPAGIPVGQVVEVLQNDVQMFQQAVVNTTVDFDILETVLVITNFAPQDELRIPVD